MQVFPNLRQQGKSNLYMLWSKFKQNHIIDYDPVDELHNSVVAYYCIFDLERTIYVDGHTPVKVNRSQLSSTASNPFVMEYILDATVIWAETKGGQRFCYKSRQMPKEDMRITDEEFFLLKLQAVNV